MSDDMMSEAAVAALLGVSLVEFERITRDPEFPVPIANDDQGHVWAGDTIRRWINASGRKS